MSATNEQVTDYRIGLDKVIDQRNRLVEINILNPACSDFRDGVVLAFDILTQVLIEHFPLLAESVNDPEKEPTKP